MRYLIASLFLAFLPISSLAWEYELIPTAALGVMTEGQRSPKPYGKAGLQLRAPLYKALSFEADVSASLYRLTYFGITYTVAPDRTIEVKIDKFRTDEKRYDYGGVFYYSFLRKNLQLDLRAGYRGIHLINDFSSFHLGGPLLGLSAAGHFKKGGVHLKLDLTPIVFIKVNNHQKGILSIDGNRSISLLGDPENVARYSLYWEWPWKKTWSLAIGYEGERMAFRRTRRYYSGLFVSFIF